MALVVLAVSSSVNAAGAVLAPIGSPPFDDVHVRIAMATSSSGTSTRWVEVVVPPHERAMWLVPARPGATIDGAVDPWLDALDRATTPHVLPPDGVPPCDMPRATDRVDPWTIAHDESTASATSSTSAAAPRTFVTAAAVLAHAADRGYRVTPDLEARIDAFYRSGWQLLALELGPSAIPSTSGTLRVTDDGGAVLPLMLTGGSGVHVTAFTMGPGVASAPWTAEIDPSQLRWGSEGSNYESLRRALVEGGAWLRETSSHAVLFDGIRSPGVEIPSVVDAYFDDPSCRERVRAVGRGLGVAETSDLSCAGRSDLALAFSSLARETAVLTRWSAVVPEGAFVSNVAFEFSRSSPERAPLFRASSYDACEVVPAPSSPAQEAEHAPVSDGCGGAVVAAGSDDGTEESVEDTSAEGCSSDSSGWDDDDTCGEDEGCPSEDTSASSDGCSNSPDEGGSDEGDDGWDSEDGDDGWDTEDGDDGWDTEDGMTPRSKNVRTKAKAPHPARGKTSKASKNKKRSPVSRVALFGAALLLPLRRRRTPVKG